jgi:hypothetical protein
MELNEGTIETPVTPAAPVVPSEPAVELESSPTDFGEIVNLFESGEAEQPEGVAEPVKVEPTPPIPPVQPKAAESTPTPPVPPTTAQPLATPEPPVQAQPVMPPVAEQPAPAPKTFTEDELKAKRGELVTMFASNCKLTDEDATELITDPNKVLPKLAGNIAVDIFEATVRTVMAQLQPAVAQILQSRETAVSARRTFFEQFPQLDKPEYIPTIRQVAQMHQQMNPNISYEEAAKQVGRHVTVLLGLPVTSPSPAAAPVAPVPQRPATPLQPGGSAMRKPSPSPGNIFEEIAAYEELDT